MQEADIAPCGMIVSPLIYERVDVSIPWLIQPFRIAVPWPDEESQHLIAASRLFQSMASLITISLKLKWPYQLYLNSFRCGSVWERVLLQ